jgi:hypothetical protein
MKRLLHIIVLTLALLGLTAPGLMAQSLPGHCLRGTMWGYGQSVTDLPEAVELSGLPAPMQLTSCPDQAILADAAPGIVAPHPTLKLPRTMPGSGMTLAEAELPPPRGS